MQLSSLLKKSLVVWAPALVAPARPSSTPSWTPPSTPPQTPSSPRPSLPWECVRLYAGQPSRIAVKLVHHVESVYTTAELSTGYSWLFGVSLSLQFLGMGPIVPPSCPQLQLLHLGIQQYPECPVSWRRGSPTPGSPPAAASQDPEPFG